MGKFSQARVTIGCVTDATLTSPNVSGSALIGLSQSTVTLDDTDLVAYAVDLTMVDAVGDAPTGIDETSGFATASYIFQTDILACSGTVGTSGNAKLTLTGADLPTSPLVVTFAVTSGDTATAWGAKALAALKASSANDYYNFTAASATEIRIQPRTFKLNDSTLNLAVANDTSTGITPVTTSTNSLDAQGAFPQRDESVDFEGITIPTMQTVKALAIKSHSGSAAYKHNGYETYIPDGATVIISGTRPSCSTATVAALSTYTKLSLVYVGTESAHGTAVPTPP